MHVAVMGAGSLGSLVGGLLATNHRVTLVGREEHMRAVAANGLRVTGEVDRTAHPATTTSWSAIDEPDVGVVTVKTYDTRSAAEEMREHPPGTVVTLQNGLGSAGVLEEVLGPQPEVLVGTATYGARLTEAGTVACTGLGSIALGRRAGGRAPVAEQLARAWADSSLECEAAHDMPRRRWEKLAVNAAINPVTALAGVENGMVLDESLWPIARAAAHEVARVANREGIDLGVQETIDTVETVARQTAANESSMAADVRRRSRTEIDAINGAVVERGAPEDVPVNRLLYGLVAGYEKGAGVREP